MRDWAALAVAILRVQDDTMYPRTISTASSSVSAGGYRTDVDITGSGYLHAVSAYIGTVNIGLLVRITVDGGTPQVVGDTSGNGMVPGGSNGVRSTNVDSMTVYIPLGNLRFNTSLRVQIGNPDTLDCNMWSGVTYSLT